MRHPLAAAMILLVLAACGGEDGGGDDGETTSDVTRASPPADAPVEGVADGVTAFTWRFLAVVPGDENVVFSPFSVAAAFSMAHAGADDATRDDLEGVLGFPDAPGVYQAMNAILGRLDDVADEDVELRIANSGWAQEGRPIGKEYLDTLARHFGAGLHVLDLQGDPSESRDVVNRWVAERTADRIEELLPEGFITPRTVYLLVNTVYLKAPWSQPFGKYPTQPAPFARADGSAVSVPMMRNAELDGRYLVEDGLQVVEIPYLGDEVVMRIVVPDDLTSFETTLDVDRWQAIEGGLQDGMVDVSLPTWDIDTMIDLADPLTELGLEIPGGDYSRIAPGVFLGQAVHGADITVDELGTEAAAGTGLGFDESAGARPDAVVRADRPYLFTVIHRPTGLILFAGRVADPS